MKRISLVLVAVAVVALVVGTGPVEAGKGKLSAKVGTLDRATIQHDSNPAGAAARFTPQDKGARATAFLQYDDGTATYRSLFLGTTPTYHWGNVFTNPGTGSFTVAAVTPFVGNPSTAGAGWPCTGQTNFIGDGVVSVAAVATATAGIYGTGTAAYVSAGWVPVAVGGAPVTNTVFAAGHLVDATDCTGATSAANHWGELIYMDLTTSGGGSGTGRSVGFTAGVSAFTGFAGGTRTIFTRATIVGPNVPVELTQFSVE